MQGQAVPLLGSEHLWVLVLRVHAVAGAIFALVLPLLQRGQVSLTRWMRSVWWVIRATETEGTTGSKVYIYNLVKFQPTTKPAQRPEALPVAISQYPDLCAARLCCDYGGTRSLDRYRCDFGGDCGQCDHWLHSGRQGSEGDGGYPPAICWLHMPMWFVAASVLVLRESKQLVPGDIVLLEAGDKVPAHLSSPRMACRCRRPHWRICPC